ncbi:MAG: 5'-3' exonuclease H3TH domain-containing protein [Halofilum sp. (in: g-proteobacteria)]|nr:5'-3' exonuclease H3TH domain-containing protein [Halofilum sp. (in: g-proteobacteria)]
MRPRLYLVDASIYVFRSWHVLPDSIVDAAGEPANAIYGFGDFLLRLLEHTRPSHLAIAFDVSLESSQRNEIYPEYKANREPAPEKLRRQFGGCRSLARAAGLAEFASPHCEADDIIATLAGRAREAGFAVTIVSGDKDLAQLVGDGDEWWDFARDRRLDRRGIERHFGVRPEQIADMLALAGDAVDNIPGVPGIGRATAARLLRRWEDLDTLYANLDGVADMKFRGAKRIAGLLAEHEALVRLSRRLTAMYPADGLPDTPAALRWPGGDAAALASTFDRLGFGQLRRRRWLEALAAAQAPA